MEGFGELPFEAFRIPVDGNALDGDAPAQGARGFPELAHVVGAYRYRYHRRLLPAAAFAGIRLSTFSPGSGVAGRTGGWR